MRTQTLFEKAQQGPGKVTWGQPRRFADSRHATGPILPVVSVLMVIALLEILAEFLF